MEQVLYEDLAKGPESTSKPVTTNNLEKLAHCILPLAALTVRIRELKAAIRGEEIPTPEIYPENVVCLEYLMKNIPREIDQLVDKCNSDLDEIREVIYGEIK